MKQILILLLFFISCKKDSSIIATLDAQITVVQNELPTFFIYGELSPVGYLSGENPITEKYGFKVKRVAGCEVKQKTIDDCTSNNKNAMALMNKKYGKNWLKNFEKETGLKW